MRKTIKKVIGIIISTSLIVSSFNITSFKAVNAQGQSYIESDVSEPTEGNVFLEVPGTYSSQDIDAAIAYVNQLRYEACEEGLAYPDQGNNAPSTTKKLTLSDYKPIKWSNGLERIAIIRVGEYSLMVKRDKTLFPGYTGHIRTNESSTAFRTVNAVNGTKSYLENVGSGSFVPTLVNELKGWASEKTAYINQSGTYGHYQVMISPYIEYFGMAIFSSDVNSANNAVAEFSHTIGAADSDIKVNLDGSYVHIVQVGNKYITDLDIEGKDYYSVGDKYALKAYATTNFYIASSLKINKGLTWSSTNPSVVKVNSSTGAIEVLSEGNATITAKLSSGNVAAEYPITVHPEGTEVKGVETPEMITVGYNKKPVLPSSLTVYLTDDTELTLPVTWEEYDKTLLKTGRDSVEFDINGTVEDIAVTQKVHVNPQTMRIQNFTRTVDSGTRPMYTDGTAVIMEDYSTEFVDVAWNKTDAYKTREGGTFVETGTFTFYYDGQDRTFETTMTITVNPATITNVTFDSTSVTTPSGTEPDYPKAKVYWSNRDVDRNVAVTWLDTEPTTENRKYMMREGGSYTLTGTCEGYDTTLTVNVEAAQPVSAELSDEDKKVETPSGTEPELPEKATVTWSNGDKTEEIITWNTIDSTDYSKIEGNKFEVGGKVAGLDVSTEVTVLPATIANVGALDKVETTQKIAPILPESVAVVWSNNETRNELIEWNEVEASNYENADSNFTVSGYLVDSDGNRYLKDGNEIQVNVNVYVNKRKLEKIEWAENSPSKHTSYFKYDKKDFKGSFIASYDNGDSQTIDVTEDMITRFDEDCNDSEQSIQIEYTEAGITKSLEATMDLVTISSLNVKTQPEKLTYIEGQNIDISGLVLEWVLSNGETREVDKDKYSLANNFTGFNSENIGEQEIVVSIDEFKTSFSITVRKKRLESIKVESNPTKCNYLEGQPIDVSGIKVTGTYDNGTNAVLNVSADNLRINVGNENPNGDIFSTSQKGNYDVKVVVSEEYDGATHFTVSDSFAMTVEEKVVGSIEITKVPTTLVIPQNWIGYNDYKFSDGKLLAHCNCDYDEEVDFSSAEVSIDDFDLALLGEQDVTVSYGGRSTTFKATVVEPTLTSKTVTPPTKTSYTEGEAVSLAGAAVVKTYDNGLSETIDLSQDAATLEAEGIKVVFVDAAGKEYAVNDSNVTTTTGAKTLVVKYKTSADGEPEQWEELKMPGGTAVSVNVQKKQDQNPSGGGNGTGTGSGNGTEKGTGGNGTGGTGTGNGNGGTGSGGTGNGSGGAKKNTLVTTSKGTQYVKADGSYAKSEWVTINGTKYYFNADSYNASNEWRDGKWIGADGSCTYSGQLLWKNNSTGWWVEDTVGWYPQDSWQKIDGVWYYFNASGYMASGEYYNGYWFNSDGSWDSQYYLSWKSDSTGWWVEDVSGWWPSSSWLKVDGYWYYFNSSGYMVTNQYVDGYWIGSDGVCS